MDRRKVAPLKCSEIH